MFVHSVRVQSTGIQNQSRLVSAYEHLSLKKATGIKNHPNLVATILAYSTN
jgi:hypothetical protein